MVDMYWSSTTPLGLLKPFSFPSGSFRVRAFQLDIGELEMVFDLPIWSKLARLIQYYP